VAAQLHEAFGSEPVLVAGRGGVFDVTVDGELVYSKHQTGQFPDPAALVQSIRSRS
jgi:selenoprotein W-related protein